MTDPRPQPDTDPYAGQCETEVAYGYPCDLVASLRAENDRLRAEGDALARAAVRALRSRNRQPGTRHRAPGTRD